MRLRSPVEATKPLVEESIHDPSNVGAADDDHRRSSGVRRKHPENALGEQIVADRENGDERLNRPCPRAVTKNVGQR